jgi:hypothetical protein
MKKHYVKVFLRQLGRISPILPFFVRGDLQLFSLQFVNRLEHFVNIRDLNNRYVYGSYR